MGLYDRDYLRDEEARYSGRGPSALSGVPITTILIAINVAVYVIDAITAQPPSAAHPFGYHPFMDSLMVSPATLYQPWMWWQFLTAGFAHSPYGVRHILFNMLSLFFFGYAVESVLGKREYLRCYLAVIVLGNLAFALRQFLFVPPTDWHPALGASGAVVAVVMSFIVRFPKQQLLLYFVIPVPAWLVGILLIAGDVWGGFSPDSLVAHDVHLTGAALAIAYWWFGWNLAWLDPTDWLLGFKRWANKPRLKVHEPESEPSYDNLDAEADRLLVKVGRDGLQSLTAREKQILEDYSRRTRQKLR